jgi:DNA-binding PadR family transcriptional regulator
MLRLYVLYKLSKKPATGYDLMQDLSSFTSGSWRPGSGSIYPIFKELEAKRLIKVVSRGSRSKQVYALTKLGGQALQDERNMFNEFATKWTRIRQMVMDMLTPEVAVSLIRDTVTDNRVTWERVIESKGIKKDDKVFRLNEYKLLMENELLWVDETLKALGKE